MKSLNSIILSGILSFGGINQSYGNETNLGLNKENSNGIKIIECPLNYKKEITHLKQVHGRGALENKLLENYGKIISNQKKIYNYLSNLPDKLNVGIEGLSSQNNFINIYDKNKDNLKYIYFINLLKETDSGFELLKKYFGLKSSFDKLLNSNSSSSFNGLMSSYAKELLFLRKKINESGENLLKTDKKFLGGSGLLLTLEEKANLFGVENSYLNNMAEKILDQLNLKNLLFVNDIKSLGKEDLLKENISIINNYSPKLVKELGFDLLKYEDFFQKKKEFQKLQEEREDFAIYSFSKLKENKFYLIYGKNHNFSNNIRDWNKKNPNNSFCLKEFDS